MNPKYDEHLRDSAPDNSRFDGFDRGDDARDESSIALETRVLVIDEEATPRKPRKHTPATSLLANGFSTTGLMPTAFVPVHTASKERRAERKLCRKLGRRQYRRATCVGYALKGHATAA